MARTPRGYWEKRQTELLKQLEKATESTINDLIKIYNKATNNINEEIRKIYKSYSKDSTLSKEVLNQLLNKKESETHQKNLLKVINSNIKDEDLKKKLITKYNAPAYSYRISRLQALQNNIDIELKHIAELEEEVTKLRYVNTIDEAYYTNIYNIQKGTGYGFNFSQLDTRTMDVLLKQKWIGNANFSQRIWENSNKLNRFMKINFTADMMTGKSVQKIAKELSEYMNIGLYNATRLVRTEVNHFANQAEMLSYEECGIEEYQFIATLDNKTSKICQEKDNKIFKIKEARVGVNYPPLHPNCRSTTVAVFNDDIDNLERKARDKDNNPIFVPQDMNYQEWKAKYIDITEVEKGAIAEYSSSKAYTLNEKLRNNVKLDKNEIELINNIDKGLNRLPNYNKITYRQIGFDFQGKEEYNKFINQHKNNKYINYGQYTSTSKNFNDYEVVDDLKIEITIEGKTGKDIRMLAGIKGENEVLFKRDTWFEIVKVDGNKIWLKEV